MIIIKESKPRLEIIQKIINNNPGLINAPQGEEKRTALHKAVKREDINLIKLFINNGGDVNKTDKYGMNAMSFACEGYSYKERRNKIVNKTIIQLLILKKAEINQEALSNAIYSKNEWLLKILLDNGANYFTDFSELNKNSMLEFILEKYGPKFTKFFPKKKLDIAKIRNIHYGRTLLHYATYAEDTNREYFFRIVNYLIKKGVDINAKDNQGENVLFYAIRFKDFDCFKFLLEKGADLSLKNKHRETLIDYALRLLIDRLASDEYGSEEAEKEKRKRTGNIAKIIQFLNIKPKMND